MKARILVVLLVLVALLGGACAKGGTKENETQPQSEADLAGTGSSDRPYRLVAQPGCYGAGCRGMNPSGMCNDGITVASKNVTDGFLELRYSKFCKANWGRYTPWRRNALGYAAQSKVMYVRITAWNPGTPSTGVAHQDTSPNNFGSSWSKMVDGTKTACTGVEILISQPGFVAPRKHSWGWSSEEGLDSQGWSWGPCV